MRAGSLIHRSNLLHSFFEPAPHKHRWIARGGGVWSGFSASIEELSVSPEELIEREHKISQSRRIE